MNFKLTQLTLFLLVISFYSNAQDLPCSATSISVGLSCNFVEYTTVGSTDSGIAEPPCGAYSGGDTWFTIQIPTSGHLEVDLLTGTATRPYLTLYQENGDCANPTYLDCDGSSSANGNYGKLTIHDNSLSGETILIRVYDRFDAVGGTFSICAWEPSIPDNDFCSDAIELNVESSCVFTQFSNEQCTSEDIIPVASCGFDYGGDVWFTVEVPASGHLVIDTNIGSNVAPTLALYSGTCGNLVEEYCDSGSSINSNFSSRITIHDESLAGTIFYVKVWNRFDVNGGTFGLCAWEPSIPDHDFCSDAIELTVGSSCVFEEYTNADCTTESNIPYASCGFDYGVDVWFTVEVPSSGHFIIDTNGGGNQSPTVAMYSGTCGNLVEEYCNSGDSNSGGLAGRINIHDESIAGETFYVKVWNRFSVIGGTFGICAWEPVIPGNDFCEFAIPLTVQDTCNFDIEYSNEHCTTEESIPYASCGFDYGVDVWFTVDVPSSGQLIVDLAPGTINNPTLALYSGSCESLTEEFCNSGSSLNGGVTGRIIINDMSYSNQTLYVKVWNRFSVQGGSFNICAWEPELPSNDFCFDALPIPVQGVECNLQEYSNLYATNYNNENIPDPSCGFYNGGDVWFSIVMPASGQLIIDAGIVDYNGIVLTAYTGSDCDNLTQLDCDQSSSDNGSFVGKLIFNEPTLVGETIFLRVFQRFNEQGGAFDLCVFDPDACGFFDVSNGEPEECNPLNDTYQIDVTFSYLNEPAGLTNVIVNDQSFPVTASPMTVTLTGLPINSGYDDLEIYFEDEPDCFYFDNNAWIAAICCEGDANNDGDVNILDLVVISSDFGCSGNCNGDANYDGTTNILDLVIVSSNFGDNCAEQQ